MKVSGLKELSHLQLSRRELLCEQFLCIIIAIVRTITGVNSPAWYNTTHNYANSANSVKAPLSCIYTRAKAKAIFFFDLCRCCCRCRINTQIGNIATDLKRRRFHFRSSQNAPLNVQ